MSQSNADRSSEPVFSRRWLAPAYWPIWVLVGLMWLLAQLPWTWQRRVGRGIGHLLYYTARSRRRVASTNIALAFPEFTPVERQQLVRRIFLETARSLPETCVAWFGDPRRTGATWQVENDDLARQAVASGRGALFVGAHFSCVDICGAYMGTLVDFDSLHRPHNNPLLNYFQHRGRRRFLGGLVARKDMRGLVRRLRRGRGIFYAPDQDLGRKHSLFVPFFGIPTATVTATSKLVQMSGCEVFLILTVRTETGYRIRVEPAPALASEDTEAALAAYNGWLERAVREDPAQYLWLHKRFKTRPEGEPSPY